MEIGMQCPFCAEDIKDEAVVCKFCRRELFIPKPLLDDQIKKLLEKNEELQSDLQQLREKMASDASAQAPCQNEAASSKIQDGLNEKITSKLLITSKKAAEPFHVVLWRYIVLPIFILVITHYVLTIIYDVNAIYMRLMSIAIPLPFGFNMYWKSRLPFRFSVIGGVVIGVVAVTFMLTTTSLIDGTSIWPSERFGWQETFEYMGSIALATIAGNSLAINLQGKTSATDPNDSFSAISRGIASMIGLQREDQSFVKQLEKIEKALAAATAVATAAGAFYTGIKNVLPH
jgi:hypothetical protein